MFGRTLVRPAAPVNVDGLQGFLATDSQNRSAGADPPNHARIMINRITPKNAMPMAIAAKATTAYGQ